MARTGMVKADLPKTIDGHPIYYHPNGYATISFDGLEIAVHRYVMEKCLGRKLRSTEVVHHKDGNPFNNSISNLEVVLWGKHSRMHNTGKVVSAETRSKMSMADKSYMRSPEYEERCREAAIRRWREENG